MAALLSQKMRVESDKIMPKSRSNCGIHRSSLVVMAKARYSTSAEEQAMVDYFLAFQEIEESLRKTQKLVTNFLASRQEAQSASEKVRCFRTKFKAKNKP